MEQRQDTLESKVTDLAAIVSRVETNQSHATELSKLRFDALDNGLGSLTGQLKDFIKRMEGLISGEIQTAAGRQMLDEYNRFRQTTTNRIEAIEDRTVRLDAEDVTRRLKAMEDRALRIDSQRQGVFATFSGTKAFVLVVAAIASPVVTVIALILR